MASPPQVEGRTAGLRERKKAKTRASIQEHALRLFREQGYDATTIEQIADAAEVSPSTFFRYFPTKEDVVLRDEYDPLLVAAFRAQPAELSAVQAMRRSFRQVFDAIPAERVEQERERIALAMAVPELRAASLDQFADTFRLLSEVVAERAGLPADDLGVRAVAGAVIGVAMAAMLAITEDPATDLVAMMDDVMAKLEDGLPL